MAKVLTPAFRGKIDLVRAALGLKSDNDLGGLIGVKASTLAGCAFR